MLLAASRQDGAGRPALPTQAGQAGECGTRYRHVSDCNTKQANVAGWVAFLARPAAIPALEKLERFHFYTQVGWLEHVHLFPIYC